MYKLPERGGGGVIRAMPERQHSFFWEVFPKLRMRTHESTGMRKQVGEERHWLWVHSSRKVDSTNLGGTLLPPWIFHPFFCQTSLDGCLLYKSLLLPTCQK